MCAGQGRTYIKCRRSDPCSSLTCRYVLGMRSDLRVRHLRKLVGAGIGLTSDGPVTAPAARDAGLPLRRSSAFARAPGREFVLSGGEVSQVLLITVFTDPSAHVVEKVSGAVDAETAADASVGVPHCQRYPDRARRCPRGRGRLLSHAAPLLDVYRESWHGPCVATQFLFTV